MNTFNLSELLVILKITLRTLLSPAVPRCQCLPFLYPNG